MKGSGDRVVLITGGARGLGRELAAAFTADGDRVMTCGRHQPESASGPAPGSGPSPEFQTCDVRDPDQVAKLIDEVAGRYGRLDVVVNNAGGTPYVEAATMSPRLFERVVALNLMAPFYVAQRANAVMQQQDGGGVIINIGSAVARRPSSHVAPYVAAKSGLVGLTRALALEWAPKVRVNQVSPGLLRTEMVEETYGSDVGAVEATVPMGRLATGADVAAACLALASPEMRYLTGADLVVDGGGETPAWLVAVEHATDRSGDPGRGE